MSDSVLQLIWIPDKTYHVLPEPDSKPAHLEQLYATVQALPDSNGIYGKDLKRFRKRLCLRVDGRCQTGIQSEEFRIEAG